MALLGFLSVAVLLILSPMVWLRPSRCEATRGQLRRYVKANGGELNFTKAPMAMPNIALMGYRLRYPGTASGSDFTLVRNEVASGALEAATDQWRWRQAPLPSLDAERREALEQWLDRLPADALIVESGKHTLCVWWQEAMGLERFQQDWASWLAMRDTLAGSGRRAEVPVSPR
ncbi:preprotein translocase subunit YajC [Salinicola halophyticus]|uniref:preprotein translocase subunit YajC n=1 Tax=Salinicola halophyticus TaxID=1808881 RepID=UPI000DA163F6|nr:preprotein translocase subunit YajC [Salinicola halophyticus]